MVSDALTAVRLAEGSVAWEVAHPEGWALEDSAGVVIGLDGPRVVRAFAPWEYDLWVERATGRRIGFRESVDGDVPAGPVLFPAPLPTRFRVEADLGETVAFWPDGQSPGAWWLRIWGSARPPRSPPTGDRGCRNLRAPGRAGSP